MSGPTFEPYASFRLEHPDSAAAGIELHAYQLPSGRILVEVEGIDFRFGSHEEADRFLENIAAQKGFSLDTHVVFDEVRVEGRPEARADLPGPERTGGQPSATSEPAPPRADDRAGLAGPEGHRPEQFTEPAQPGALRLDAGDMAIGVGKAVLGTALGLGVAMAAGPVAGAGLLGGLLFVNFMSRYNEAAELGTAEGAALRALTAGISDMLPISPVEAGEAAFGFDYVTQRPLSNSERSEILGASVGGFAAGAFAGVRPRTRLPRGAPRGVAADGIDGVISRDRAHIRQLDGRLQLGIGGFEVDINPNAAGMFGGGEIGIRRRASPNARRVRSKTGLDPRSLSYKSNDPPIMSYERLRNLRIGLDANHLLLGEWFKKGPAHLRPLYGYVPSTPLLAGVEHQGTFHGDWIDLEGSLGPVGQRYPGLNAWLESQGLFKRERYSQMDIERGIDAMEALYRTPGPVEPWASYAAAVRKFRLEIFGKVKK